MAERLLRFRNLSLRERRVLCLLRGHSLDGTDASQAAGFAPLAREARAASLVVAEPYAIHVTADEKKLLAWLALLQRLRPLDEAAQESLGPALLAELAACARLLEEKDLRLGYVITARVDRLWNWGDAASRDRRSFHHQDQ